MLDEEADVCQCHECRQSARKADQKSSQRRWAQIAAEAEYAPGPPRPEVISSSPLSGRQIFGARLA